METMIEAILEEAERLRQIAETCDDAIRFQHRKTALLLEIGAAALSIEGRILDTFIGLESNRREPTNGTENGTGSSTSEGG